MSASINDSYNQRAVLIEHSIGHTIGLDHNDPDYGARGARIPRTFQANLYYSYYPDPTSVMNPPDYYGYINSYGFSKMDVLAIRYPYPLDLSQTPIYRYVSNNYTKHFYTCDWYELNFGNSSWIYRGCEGYIYSTSGNNSRAPVYRYYKISTGDHLYTTNFNELGNGAYGYNRETNLGYAYSYSFSGTVPLYRFRQNCNNIHFYTQNYCEGAGWICRLPIFSTIEDRTFSFV